MRLLADVSLASYWGAVVWVGVCMFIAGYAAGRSR